jgi:2'-5' RNA ligase
VIPKRIKWVVVNSMHVTIKFIGDFNVIHKEPLHKDLLSILHRIGKMKISFTEIGGFPNLNRPRVIWLGLDYPQKLGEIARAVDFIASKYEYPKETRRFSPHVTLGRVRKDTTSIDRERIGKIINENRQVEIPPFECEKLYFFQSTLTPKGPIYSILAEIPL